MSQSTRSELSPEATQADHLFAGFLGLFVVIAFSRLFSLSGSPLQSYFPILIYQDVAFWSLIAWFFYGLLRLSGARRAALVAGWGVCILIALYTAIDLVIYLETRSPLTYRLWLAADDGRGIEASVSQAASLLRVFVPGFLIVMVVVAVSLWWFAPNVLTHLRKGFYSPFIAVVMFIYVLGANWWTTTYVTHRAIAANPEWALVSSLFDQPIPRVTEIIPADYIKDFLPATQTNAAGVLPSQSAVVIPAADPSAHSPMNILMIVMESTGAKRLQLYGASYKDSPEMVRLADHGVVFDHIYAAQSYTSAAMAGLFCSLYPEQGWLNLLRQSPEIGVTGLADVLAAHGYRTAFLHEGQLGFDNQLAFIESHGFQQVFFRDKDPLVSDDSALVPIAENWIKSDNKKPFFLLVWTQDTHHPYLVNSSDDYGTGNPRLNKYLNAVRSTDSIIAQLMLSLDELNIADNTIVVITGDHGEAFGEHGQLAHGFTTYNEELHIPLMLVNPKLFPHGIRNASLGRQIDIAPTLLGLLGYDKPQSWQGTNLLGAHPAKRAYLFSYSGDFSLGLVEGDFKYIHDFDQNRDELYDLSKDPEETRDLSAEPEYKEMVARDRLRVDAWLSFQDKYLASFPAAHENQPSVEHKME